MSQMIAAITDLAYFQNLVHSRFCKYAHIMYGTVALLSSFSNVARPFLHWNHFPCSNLTCICRWMLFIVTKVQSSRWHFSLPKEEAAPTRQDSFRRCASNCNLRVKLRWHSRHFRLRFAFIYKNNKLTLAWFENNTEMGAEYQISDNKLGWLLITSSIYLFMFYSNRVDDELYLAT